MADWVTAKVASIEHWTERLYSLRLMAPIASFQPGQFIKLGLRQPDGTLLQRAYSFVNPPNDRYLEFYIAAIPVGLLSQQLQRLQQGSELSITRDASGFFTLSEIPTSKNLWMFATGAALGPYLSMLQYGNDLDRFEKIVLVHAARQRADLNYATLMTQLADRYQGKLITQTIVSQEQSPHSLSGRIPQLIANGRLEQTIGLSITAEDSHVMLCGNPAMIAETRQLLRDSRGMRKHLRRKAGQISSEQYW